jgi:hypothetical protein
MARRRRSAGHALALMLALAAGAPREARAQLFFNGEGPSPLGSFASWVNSPTNTTNQVVFDRFSVPTGQIWTASAVFGEFSSFNVDPAVTALFWQIRTGMSSGAGVGTVVASGSGAAGIVGDRYTVAVAPLILGPGDYWLGMYADLTGVASSPNNPFFGPGTTDGTNSINASLDNAALWLTGPDAALAGGTVSSINDDISYGMHGQFISAVVPEPTTWALLGAGLLALGAVRRRRTS